MKKLVRIKVLSLFLFQSISFAGSYSITLDDPQGSEITSSQACSDKIGRGGNLVEGSDYYLGKCEGSGLSPQINGKAQGRYLEFSNNHNYKGGIKTRSELALTEEYFPFNERKYIGFKIQIPHGVSSTDDFFYLMQFWQCSPASPIAGIRVSRGDGNSHNINFMTRNDSSSKTLGYYSLTPGAWHSVIIMIDPSSRSRYGKGEMKVWIDQNGKALTYEGNIGYNNLGTCEKNKYPPQHYRLKFGIYKGDEPGRKFNVRYDDIRIGSTYSSVKPW